jgi:hypothetical protein
MGNSGSLEESEFEWFESASDFELGIYSANRSASDVVVSSRLRLEIVAS